MNIIQTIVDKLGASRPKTVAPSLSQDKAAEAGTEPALKPPVAAAPVDARARMAKALRLDDCEPMPDWAAETDPEGFIARYAVWRANVIDGALAQTDCRYAQAESFIREAAYQAEGLTVRQVALSQALLGGICYLTGQLLQAEQAYKRSLALCEEVDGPLNDSTAVACDNLAQVYQAQGKLAEAEALHLKALAVLAKVKGTASVNYGIVLGNLASLYMKREEYGPAESLFRESLSIDIRNYGLAHREVATTFDNLAAAIARQGRWEEAELLCRSALVTYDKTIGRDHPETGKCLNNLAALHMAQCKYAEAVPIYEEAYLILVATIGGEHQDVRGVFRDLAFAREMANPTGGQQLS